MNAERFVIPDRRRNLPLPVRAQLSLQDSTRMCSRKFATHRTQAATYSKQGIVAVKIFSSPTGAITTQALCRFGGLPSEEVKTEL
jgi:hypothetical protein